MTRAAPTWRLPTIDGLALWHRLQDDGGYTVDPDTGEIPRSGYAVSLPGFQRVYATGTLRPADVVTGLQDARQAQRIYPDTRVYAGAWDDGHGRQYLDASTVVPGPHEAYRLAREYGQLAYYDLAHDESVSVWEDAA